MLRFIIFVACLAAPILPVAAQPCGGETIGAVTVASVSDGRSFKTTDGREVRLAGIETPGPKAALETLIAGQLVTLKQAGKGEDRYGRILAYGTLGNASIEEQLLRAGDAYAAARIGSKGCADALFPPNAPPARPSAASGQTRNWGRNPPQIGMRFPGPKAGLRSWKGWFRACGKAGARFT